jgi:hypothetical protein
MALSKIDVANMLTGATPVANGGTALTSGFKNGTDPRPTSKPIIVNGNMAVSQRSTSVTGIGNGGEGYHTIDRFKFEEGNTPSAVWTMTQESLTSGNAYNAGFTKALKMDCTTSDDASGHANILNVVKYATERQDTHLFKKGTANAEKYTVAFWIKATKTGTHICELRDSTNDRAVSVAYTVSTTNTWEHKVLNFPADTTGAIGTGNSKGLEIYWSLYSGSGYQGATLQTAWGGASTNARYTGQVNNADSTSNNWHLTGVQLEIGEFSSTTLPPFQHESYGDNLIRCQRYYEKSFEQGTTPAAGVSAPDGRVFGSWDGQSARTEIDFNTTKRASPTVTVYRGANTGSGTGTGTANFIYSGAWNNHGTVTNHADDSHVSLTATTGNFTTNAAHVADMNFTADAEL